MYETPVSTESAHNRLRVSLTAVTLLGDTYWRLTMLLN